MAEVETRRGVCRYCGQMCMIEINKMRKADLDELDEDEQQEYLDALATEDCTCSFAEQLRQKQASEENAIANIDYLFGEDAQKYGTQSVSEELLTTMKEAVRLISKSDLQKATFGIYDGIKAVITVTAKGEIKVERTDTKKRSLM